MSSPAPITRPELHDLLVALLPRLTPDELAPVATALHLILKAGRLAKAASPAKPKSRQYREKPVAESLRLKL